MDIDTLTGFVKPNTAAGNDYVVLTAARFRRFCIYSFPSIPGANPSVNLVWSWSVVGKYSCCKRKDPCNPDNTAPLTITCRADTIIFTNPANQCTSPYNIQALASFK
ncbi:MAG: hypothetical protein IPO65_16490 [Saprospiraceae bacterium]|nr:hypothetical protein [Saprospiraceae bacterium]